jgi:hypothetical protein
MSPKHHTHTQRCCGMASSMTALWIGPFGVLSCYYDCACNAAFQGQIPRTQKLMHIPSEVFEPLCLLQCLRLARLEDAHGFRT